MGHKFLSCSALFAISWALAGSPAMAQEAATDGGVEEIVVTAQKREQNLQDVGISVTAFSGDDLTKLGFSNATDIIRQVPGLDILSSSASNTNVSIRGVSQNDFADHLEGPVAVYADEGYLGAAGAINGQIYDLERVEVLRGPQGTLFGRNATGGLIHYVSRAPTKDFEGYAQVDFGEYNLLQFEGAVSGPLSDTVRARLSYAGIRRDGFVKNLIGPDPGNQNNYSGRLQLAFDLSETTELRLMVNGTTTVNERGLAGQTITAVVDANGQGRALGANEVGTYPNIALGGNLSPTCAGCDLFGYRQPSDVFKRAYSDVGSFQKDILHAQAKLTSEIGNVGITWISDYLYLKKDFLNQDIDGTPTRFFQFNTRQKYNQFSQELRLDGESGNLKWLAGFYYLNLKGDYQSAVEFDVSRYVGAPVCGLTPGFPCPTPIPGVTGTSTGTYSIDTESFSGFGQLEYKISDSVSLIGGLRYTHDRKIADYSWTTTAFPIPGPTLYNRSVDPAADRTFKNISAKAEIDWHPSDDTLVYLSYSRGHKGGNWQLPVFPPPITPANFPAFPHKQEVLTAYETGLKTQFWDGKAQFNVGLFYYDYHDYQAFSLVGLSLAITNREAKAWGGEAELVLAPTRGLHISLSASSETSRIYGLKYPTGVGYTGVLPFSPKLSLNGLVRYEWDALGGKLAAQASFTSKGPHYFSATNEPITREVRYFTADARFGWTSANDTWNAALWVKNLTDERYRFFRTDISVLSFGNQNFAPPRQFGGTVGVKF